MHHTHMNVRDPDRPWRVIGSRYLTIQLSLREPDIHHHAHDGQVHVYKLYVWLALGLAGYSTSYVARAISMLLQPGEMVCLHQSAAKHVST